MGCIPEYSMQYITLEISQFRPKTDQTKKLMDPQAEAQQNSQSPKKIRRRRVTPVPAFLRHRTMYPPTLDMLEEIRDFVETNPSPTIRTHVLEAYWVMLDMQRAKSKMEMKKMIDMKFISRNKK